MFNYICSSRRLLQKWRISRQSYADNVTSVWNILTENSPITRFIKGSSLTPQVQLHAPLSSERRPKEPDISWCKLTPQGVPFPYFWILITDQMIE